MKTTTLHKKASPRVKSGGWQRLTIHLPDSIYERTWKQAHKERRSASKVVQAAMEAYLIQRETMNDDNF